MLLEREHNWHKNTNVLRLTSRLIQATQKQASDYFQGCIVVWDHFLYRAVVHAYWQLSSLKNM